MNAFIFPGQGSQKVGMGRVLCERFPLGRVLFERASALLGYDLMRLCWDGPAEELTQTLHAQPALLTLGIICHQEALAKGLQTGMTAGHSLGEYAALVAAGALGFEDALRLVQRRAQLMAAAPAGAMAAIVGLSDDAVAQAVLAASEEGMVVPANFNSPGQVVVSGEPQAIEAVMREAKAGGAKMTVKLPVSGAFHSPLMQEAAREMADLIESAPFQNAAIPVYQNSNAQPATSAADLRAALRAQMTGAVRWSDTIRAMIGDGATHFYELGPGNVLTGLVKRIDKSVAVEGGEC